MITSHQIHWLAGLAEGEASFFFGSNHTATFSLDSTDEDVVRKVASLLQAKSGSNRTAKLSGKPVYRVYLTGSRAIGLMMTLYALMGRRRREQIVNTLMRWYETEGAPSRVWNEELLRRQTNA